MTWLTEERTSAPAAGAPGKRRATGAPGYLGGIQITTQVGSVPAAFGPGLVCGSDTVTLPTNDHAAMGRTARHGTPLGSPGAGFG